MSVEMVANLIPLAAEYLKLGIFNKVAVRETDRNNEFVDRSTGEPDEVLTYYRSVRTAEKKTVIQALHIHLKGNINEQIQAFAFVGSYPSKKLLYMGQSWSYITTNSRFYNTEQVAQASISFEELSVFLSDAINKAQAIFEITPSETIHKDFQATVNYLTSLYKNEKAYLDMMSVHISSNRLSFSITCETGWGSDYHFNVTKDKKCVAMKIEIDPREVEEGESSTYRDTETIKSSDEKAIYDAFTTLMQKYGLIH